MRRRALLRSVPAVALAGVAGCASVGRPAVRMDSGSATLHPASELFIAHGLQPDGNDRVFVTATADESPDVIGPDAEDPIADALRNPGTDQFHVVVQLRSSPDAPMEIWPDAGGAFEWTGRSTLRARVEVEPWGPLDRIDDEQRRDELRSAEELVYTGVWTLTPEVDDLPSDVELVLASRR